MQKALTSALIPLLMLPGCALFAGGRPVVTTQRAGCPSLIPKDWANGTPAAEIVEGIVNGNAVIGDWIIQTDREAARADVIDDKLKATIHIVTACDERDAAGIKQATKRKFLGLF